MILIVLKWGKEKYDLDVENEMTIEDFRALIYSLTSVPPEN